MIKNLCSLVFCFICFNGLAQITNEGTPASWDIKKEKSALMPILLPSVDILKIRNEDAKNNSDLHSKRLRVGVLHKVNYGLDNGGVWTELPNGDRIWRILFSSKDAIHLSVIFDKFYLPEGGKIYLYNNDKTDLLGAYTHTQNNEKQVLSTWFVMGEKLWIEYYEPKKVIGKGKLNLSSVIHGYRLGHDYQKGYLENSQKSLNSSGECNHDVDCPIGADFAAQRDLLKKSVAFITIPDPVESATYVCTGTLINNTDQDKTPYFLTANHCYQRDNGSLRDPALSVMRFNWISPNPVCAATTNSTDAAKNLLKTGATLKARYPLGDMMLVELNTAIPSGWDVTYAGWDRTITTPNFVVGIHHPDGDIMKICRDDSGVTQATITIGSQTSQTWQITSAGGGWELGVTEGGSSGSALFNQDGRIIGQLFGGSALCSGTDDNGAADFYGRFATSWNGGGSNATQLSNWLDPLNSNPTTLDALQNVLAVNDEFLEQNISVYPNPTTGILQVKTSGLVGELSYEVFNVLGQLLKSDTLVDNINLSSLSDNIYFVKIIEIDSKKIIVKKIVLSK